MLPFFFDALVELKQLLRILTNLLFGKITLRDIPYAAIAHEPVIGSGYNTERIMCIYHLVSDSDLKLTVNLTVGITGKLYGIKEAVKICRLKVIYQIGIVKFMHAMYGALEFLKELVVYTQ